MEKEKLIIVTDKDNDNILLHEMIHAYEVELRKKSECHRQYIIIRLTEKLLPKINDLIKIISFDHRPDQRIQDEQLLIHNPLFILKSLELDITLKQPIGTIFGYEKEKDYKKLISE